MTSESELQAQAIDLGHLCGWLAHHTRPARLADGSWRTPISGDAGFVDVVFAHERHGLRFVEFKSGRGKLSPEQARWGSTLQLAISSGDVSYQVWRPDDWPEIEQQLRGRT